MVMIGRGVRGVTRRLHTGCVRLQQKSSDVVTSSTKEHLRQKQRLKPNTSTVESFQKWIQLVWNPEASLQRTQDSLMKIGMSDYYQGSCGDLRAWNAKTVIDTKTNQHLNEIVVENGHAPMEEDPEAMTKNLVMLHGYSASLGGFYKNFDGLVRNQSGVRIHALDLVGFGLSTKTKLDTSQYDQGTKEFPLSFDANNLTHAKHIHSSLKLPESYTINAQDITSYNVNNSRALIGKVEDYYIDALEKWREAKGLENFTLLGHSLGGYLSLAYALKYPSRVAKLILVSPGGIERSPFAITNPIFSNTQAAEGSLTFTPSMQPDSYHFLGRYPTMSEIYRKFWNLEISPFVLLRKLGPLSYPLLYKNFFVKLARNLSNFKDLDEVKTFIDYTYYSVMQKSNAEYLIMKIFASNVVAKFPMYDRLQDLQVKKVAWYFGQYDYMYNSIGDMSAKKLNSLGKESIAAIIPKSGHNLYLDNYKEFNNQVKQFLKWS